MPELFFDRKKYPRVLNEALLLLMFLVGNQSVLALSFVLIVTLYHSRSAVSKFVGLVFTELFLFIIHCYAYKLVTKCFDCILILRLSLFKMR